MEYSITQDENGTHLSWQHPNVHAKEIDWFWSNMEKCFLLWHPEEHEPLQWAIPPKHQNLTGAVHIAPQTWSDGQRQNLYIRFENFEHVPEVIKNYVEYEHCIIVAGLGFGEESLYVKEPLGFRVHQWQDTQSGVIGKANAFGWKKSENHEQGMVWAKHAATEIANWGVFLPTLFDLYQVVKNPLYNPFMDLTIKKQGTHLTYIHLINP